MNVNGSISAENPLPVGSKHLPIRFVPEDSNRNAILMKFTDPRSVLAVGESVEITTLSAIEQPFESNDLDLVLLPIVVKDHSAVVEAAQHWLRGGKNSSRLPGVATTVQGVQIFWVPGRVVLLGALARMDVMVPALIEFHFFEFELANLESEIAAAWAEYEQDSRLAYSVTIEDLEREEEVGQRMAKVLNRRMRHLRIEGHLYAPGGFLISHAQELGEKLREKTRVEERLELVDGQIETFEHVYEMCGQRISEFKAARQSSILEWVIIVLLAVETILLLIDLIWNLQSETQEAG